MKKIFFILLPIFLVVAAILVVGATWWSFENSAPSGSPDEISILINKGSSGQTIAQKLKDAGVIRSTFVFRVYLRIHNLTTKLPTGEFKIAKNHSLPETIAILLKGPSEFWVTIPEGLRREEIPDKFIKDLGLNAVEANSFRASFLATSANMEGYLFPDTYLLPRDVTGEKSANLMRATFDKKFDSSNLGDSGLTLNEVVTMASILERETVTAEERPIVAGIFFNRLRDGVPLQADATVQYALANSSCRGIVDCDWWPRPITRDDLGIASAYNTYKNVGLPPAPIANPGLTSLNAVVNSESTDYFYYIHDSSGLIHYAKTLEEHNANVAKYLGK